MTRRRLLGGLLLVSAVLACFAGWLWIDSRPRVTRARFEQVKAGISRNEVIRTLGGPPGDYSSDKYMSSHVDEEMRIAGGVGGEWWACEDALLLVQFDAGGTVTGVSIHKVSRRPLTQRIRKWLGL